MFYYYLGVMRLTDQEKIVIAKIVCYSQYPIGRSCHTIWRGTTVSQETEGVRGKYELEPLLWFPWIRQGQAG